MTEEILPRKLTEALDELLSVQKEVVAAIDGMCASGKTTLAEKLEKVYGCNVFHMDDFFLQPHKRTDGRLQKPGENVDWERFEQEVLLPVKAKQTVTFRPYHCAVQKMGEKITVPYRPFTLVEGVYSMNTHLEKYYDFSLFMTVDPDTQSRRILKRNGAQMHRRFQEEFIPLENFYFEKTAVKTRCSMTLEGIF